MKFISAEWVDDATGGKIIRAVGDDDSVWWVPVINSDVPPWPEFIAEYGEAAVTGEPPVQEPAP